MHKVNYGVDCTGFSGKAGMNLSSIPAFLKARCRLGGLLCAGSPMVVIIHFGLSLQVVETLEK